MFTRYNCSAEANGTFSDFVSLPALWVPLIQWVAFDTNTNAQILKCMLFLQKEKTVFGDCFAWFSTDHTFENAIDRFCPPTRSLSHMGNVSSHLLESTYNEQDPALTRQHITSPMFSAEISVQTQIIPYPIAGKDFLIHKTISWKKNKNNRKIHPFRRCFHSTATT